MKRTTRKLQEVDTIPGLGAAASGLMAGFNGLGNMGQMFSRVGQFFQNLRPAAGAARTARGGSDGATELTPVRWEGCFVLLLQRGAAECCCRLLLLRAAAERCCSVLNCAAQHSQAAAIAAPWCVQTHPANKCGLPQSGQDSDQY